MCGLSIVYVSADILESSVLLLEVGDVFCLTKFASDVFAFDPCFTLKIDVECPCILRDFAIWCLGANLDLHKIPSCCQHHSWLWSCILVLDVLFLVFVKRI